LDEGFSRCGSVEGRFSAQQALLDAEEVGFGDFPGFFVKEGVSLADSTPAVDFGPDEEKGSQKGGG